MGSSGSKGKNKKDFQSVVPYSNKLSPAKAPMRKSVAPLVTTSVNNNKGVELDKESISAIREVASKGWTPNPDFRYTEGQVRRSLMQSCEEECSEILHYLYVGGVKVASSRESLRKSNIRQIINCSPSVVGNYFENDSELEYLTFNMLDGRDDDIGWFICHVIEFVELGRLAGKNTLIHCEKGISRSCSCAIGYIMWASATDFHTAFDFVKERRPVCAPNTGFTCNLIEIGSLLHGEARQLPALFRLAYHLEHDPNTPILKICRHPGSRRILYPRMSHLVSQGVFVLRPADGRTKRIFVWKGNEALDEDASYAMRLAAKMTNIFSYAESIELIHEHAEPLEFRDHVHQDDMSSEINEFTYKDLFSSRGRSLPVNVNGTSSRKNSLRHTSGVTLPVDADGEESSTSTVRSRKEMEIRELVKQHSSFLPPLQLTTVQRTPSAPFSRVASFVSKEDPTSARNGSASLQPLSFTGLKETTSIGMTPRLVSSRESSSGASPRPASCGSRSGVILMGFGSDGSISPRPTSRHDSLSSPRPLLVSSPMEDGLNGERSPLPYDEYLPPLHVLAIESATVGGTFESYRARHPDNMEGNSPVHNEAKPRLYECAEIDGKHSWQHIAVYDDNDLDDDVLLLLVCPVRQQYYLWLGDKFFRYKTLPPLALVVRDMESEGIDNNDVYAPDAIKQWIVSNVTGGDITLEDAALGDMILKCSVETQGNETSEWWAVFQDGF